MESPSSKVCRDCQRDLPLTEFCIRKNRYIPPNCKACEWAYQRQWRQTARGAALTRASSERYQQTEQRQAAMHRYNSAPGMLAKKKAWAQSEAGKAWRRVFNRSQKRKEIMRRYSQSPKGREKARLFHQTPKGRESLLRGVHARRARIMGQTPVVSRLTAQEWESIKQAHGNACLYCGATDRPLTRDHVIPLKLGGQHVKENIVPACRSCNGRKGARAAP